MRGRFSNRSQLVLDLPMLKPDNSGRIDAKDFEHYNRTLLEWARNVADQIESRAVVDQLKLFGNSVVFNTVGAQFTDMNLLRQPVRGGHFYGVHVNSTVALTGANGRWILDATATGPIPSLGRVADLDTDVRGFVDGWVFWRQPIDAVIDIFLIASSDLGTLQFEADADIPRSMELVGFGPAPIEPG